MDPSAYNYLITRLELKKQTVKEKMDEFIEEMFCNMINEFSHLAEANKKEKEPGADMGQQLDPAEMGNCVDQINAKINYMLMKTYEEAFVDYEQGLEYAKDPAHQQLTAENGDSLIFFETTPVKKRKRNKDVIPDDRA